jgi:hypothetical protein
MLLEPLKNKGCRRQCSQKRALKISVHIGARGYIIKILQLRRRES